MIRVLVTGAGGMLAHAIHTKRENDSEWLFMNRKQLDITDSKQVLKILNEHKPSYLINCAAYTAVDPAEDNKELATAVNTTAVQNLAQVCKELDICLIHISTDYVFNGESDLAYAEEDITHPINHYGKTKRAGELAIIESGVKHFILRSSWLYSDYGANFYNFIKNTDKRLLNIVDNQIGTPTSCYDLADFIIKIILTSSDSYGVYHFTNAGSCSWYAFAKAIQKKLNKEAEILPTTHYPSLAERPKFSQLNCDKAVQVFDLKIRDWQVALLDMK